MGEPDDELTVLRAELHELRREVGLLRSLAETRAEPEPEPEPVTAPVTRPVTTRRGMLRLAGAAAVGAGASLLGRSPVAADNGLVTTNAGVTTTLSHNSPTGFHFRSSDSPYVTNSEVIQASAGPTNRHCLRAFSNNGTSAIFVRNEGIGSAILAAARGGGAAVTIVNSKGPILNLNQTAAKVAPGLRTDEFHPVGGLDVDGQGNLWYCIGAGTAEPGEWQKLGGPTTAGALHAISPIRVYDSRLAAYNPNGRRNPNTSMVVSVRDARALDSGAVTQADAVPAGATAVAYNLVAVGTTGANFFAVTKGDAPTFGAASLAWATAGQTVTVSSIVPLDTDRQVKVFCGPGTGGAHVVIDIVGYWQ